MKRILHCPTAGEKPFRSFVNWIATPAIVVASALFLGAGWSPWLSRTIDVEVGIRAPDHTSCTIFWTETPGGDMQPSQSKTIAFDSKGAAVAFSIPAKRISRIRFKPNGEAGTLRASRLRVSGREVALLDWRTFDRKLHIVDAQIDGKKAIDLVWDKADAFLETSSDIGVEGRLRVDWGNLVVRIVVLVLLLLTFVHVFHGAKQLSGHPDHRVSRTLFFATAAVFVVARMALTAKIPPFFGPSTWDDVWFANAGYFLANGEWLGPYGCHTLCKGFFGPAVLAFSQFLGIPFLLAETLLYIAGCCFSVFVLSRLSSNRALLLLTFLLLLFNPVSWAPACWHGIYRNAMPGWLAPFVIGCFFLLFLEATGPLRKMLFWAFCTGLAMWAFLNTREDGIWLWPYALSCTVAAFLRIGKQATFPVWRRLTCLVPFCIVLCGNVALSAINWHTYGRFIRNDRDAGNYAQVMKDLYLIAPDADDEKRLSGPECAGHYHNIYYSTLCKAYEASPTLASIRPKIDWKIDDWKNFNHYHSRDLHWDHMLFAIREGASDAGVYRSLPVAEKFFGDVHAELSRAFADGRLRQRGLPLTALAAPFRPKMIPGIFREWKKALLAAVGFEGLRYDSPKNWTDSPIGKEQRRVFEAVSGSRMVFGAEALPLESAVSRANAVAIVFEKVGPYGIVLALLGYAAVSLMLLNVRQRPRIVFGWLLSTGILASVLVHTACIAYVTETTYMATRYWYLVASSQLSLLFACSVVATGFEALSSKSGEPPPVSLS